METKISAAGEPGDVANFAILDYELRERLRGVDVPNGADGINNLAGHLFVPQKKVGQGSSAVLFCDTLDCTKCVVDNK